MALFDSYLSKNTGSQNKTETKITKTPTGACGKIKLARAYYASSKLSAFGGTVGSNGKLQIAQGWVVMGFLGGESDKYIVPVKYQGLPVIGIHYLAYEALNGFNDRTYEGCYKTVSPLKPHVYFYNDVMHFVMPSWRYSDRRRIVVDYNSTEYAHPNWRSGKNKVSYFTSVRFCFNKYLNGTLADLIRISGAPANYAYGLAGIEDKSWNNVERWYSDFGTPKKKYENWRVCVGLDNSCQETYSSSHGYGWTLKSAFNEDNPAEFMICSFDALRVGKYYDSPYRTRYNARDEMTKSDCVLAFYQVDASGDNTFAYFTVKNSEVIINSDENFAGF